MLRRSYAAIRSTRARAYLFCSRIRRLSRKRILEENTYAGSVKHIWCRDCSWEVEADISWEAAGQILAEHMEETGHRG